MSAGKKKRRPDLSKIRTSHVYTVAEFAATMSRTNRTVLGWIKDGMPTVDSKKPYLIDGAEGKVWLKEKWKQRKTPCKLNELYCAPCGDKRHPAVNSFTYKEQPNGTLKLEADCPECGTRMHITRSNRDKDQILSLMSRFTDNVEHLSGYLQTTANRQLNAEARSIQKNRTISGGKS